MVSALTRERGMIQCGQGGGGEFFAILYGRLLWTAPYQLQFGQIVQIQITNIEG